MNEITFTKRNFSLLLKTISFLPVVDFIGPGMIFKGRPSEEIERREDIGGVRHIR
jgi:hypothetical protein